MRVLITGGAGFIGHALAQDLIAHGHECVLLTRRPRPSRAQLQYVEWNLHTTQWHSAVDGVDAVIHLAGESVVGKRWTPRHKRVLHKSRVDSALALVDAIATARRKPTVFISASAVGYYGDRGDERLTEESSAGNDFLAHLVTDWEAAAARAVRHGVRVVSLRFGMVLGPDGGVFARLHPIFRMGLGGRLGSGRQWISWIHRDDIVGVVHHALTHDMLRGPVNVVSPQPVTNADFTRTLGTLVHRPTWCHIPAMALRWILGEQATVLLNSQRVIPKRLTATQYAFRYADLTTALQDCIQQL